MKKCIDTVFFGGGAGRRKEIMPNKPKDIVTGRITPVNDQTGKQIEKKQGKKWRITAELPRRGGEKKRKRKYRDIWGSERKAKEEKERFVAELNTELNSKTISSSYVVQKNSISVSDYMREWLTANRYTHLKQRTWETYMGYAEKHIIPTMGHLLLGDVEPYHISRYKDLKLNEGLDSSTVNKHLSLISNILDEAASPEKQLIYFNSALLVKRAKGKKNAVSAVNCLNIIELNDLLYRLWVLYSMKNTSIDKLSSENVSTLRWLGYTDKEIESPKALHRFRATMLYPIVYVAAKTGMRLSELLALKWANIDFDRKEIKVFESSHYGNKTYGAPHHINSTKEGTPKAFIDLAQEDIDFLKLYRKEQAKEKLLYEGEYWDKGLVFAAKNGDYLRNEMVSKEFTNFARANGFEISFHGLRHTHCTLLLGAGADVMYVSRRVGHKKPSTTHSIYSHADKVKGINLGESFTDILKNEANFPDSEMKNAQEKTKSILNKGG